jgi:hypothetical protein
MRGEREGTLAQCREELAPVIRVHDHIEAEHLHNGRRDGKRRADSGHGTSVQHHDGEN